MSVELSFDAYYAGHHDEAKESLDKALAVNPSSLDALALRAAIAFVADKPQEFDAEVAKVLAIAPNNTEPSARSIDMRRVSHLILFAEPASADAQGAEHEEHRGARLRDLALE